MKIVYVNDEINQEWLKSALRAVGVQICDGVQYDFATGDAAVIVNGEPRAIGNVGHQSNILAA